MKEFILFKQFEAYLQLNNLFQFQQPLDFTRGWTASPDLLLVTVKEILKEKKGKPSLTIVEFGSGVSTIILGYTIKKYFREGLLISLEHSYDFYKKTKEEIVFHGLNHLIKLIYAPLVNHWINNREWLYYDVKESFDLLKNRKIDVLFVDGPPSFVQRKSRYPAIPLFKNYLADNCIIFLDDTYRDDEKQISLMWKKDLQVFASKDIETEKGTLILKRVKVEEYPFFSVCIPTYNRKNFLKEALKSALSQTYGNFEVIIYDDGSTDGTEKLVKEFKDPRIRYFKGEINKGRPYARNNCVKLARGEWIVWLDDDDIIQPELLSRYALAINQFPDVSVFYPLYLQVYHKKTKKGELCRYMDFYLNRKACIRNLMSGSPIPNPGVCIRKDVYSKFGFYDEEFIRAQDYEFWFRVLPYVDIKGIDYVGVTYRIHGENVSTDLELMDCSYESLTKRKFLSAYSLDDIYYFSPSKIELFVSDLIRYEDYFNACYYLWVNKKQELLKKLMDISGLSRRNSKNDKLITKLFHRFVKANKIEAALKISERLGLLYGLLLKAYVNNVTDRNKEKLLSILKRIILIDPFFDFSAFSLDKEEINKIEETKDRVLRVVNSYEYKKEGFLNTFWRNKTPKIEDEKEINSAYYYHQAEVLYNNDQETEAIKLFEKTLELDPNFALAHNDLAYIYWQKRNIEKALHHITKAMELAPDNRDIIWNFGQIMLGLGYAKDACKVYKDYLKRHPGEKEIRQVVEELEKGQIF